MVTLPFRTWRRLKATVGTTSSDHWSEPKTLTNLSCVRQWIIVEAGGPRTQRTNDVFPLAYIRMSMGISAHMSGSMAPSNLPVIPLL